MKFVTRFYLLVVFLLGFMAWQGTASAQQLSVEQIKQQKKVVLGQHLKYQALEQQVDIQTVVERFQLIDWQTFSKDLPVLPYSQQAYWFYFDISNTSFVQQSLYLDYQFPLVDHITVYQQDSTNGVVEIMDTNLTQSIEERLLPSADFVVPLTLVANSQTRILIRIENDGLVQVPMYLVDQPWLTTDKSINSFWLGAGLALLVVLSIFSLIVYVLNRDVSFLYYAVFSAFFFIYYSAATGYPIEFLWPSYPAISQDLSMFSLGISLAGVCLFASAFLHLREKVQWLHKSALGLCGLFAASSLIGIFVNHYQQIQLQVVIFVLCAGFLLSSGIYVWAKKYQDAGRFVICFSLITLSCALFAANRFGVIPRNIVTEYSLLVSQFFAFIVIFEALSSRIKQERSQRLKAQLEALHHYEQFYDIYENAVEGHFTTTVDGRLLRANKAFCDLVGYINFEELAHSIENILELYVSPDEREKLVARAKEFGRVYGFEAQWRRTNGKKIWVSINLRFEPKTPEGPALIGSLIDISQKKRSDKQLQFLAAHDSLTGLLNRREFERILNEALIECSQSKVKHTLLYMDLDQFKVVNDTCGHKAGDILLRQLTDELKDILNKQGIIARLGGDEFGVLIKNKIGDDAFVIAFQLKQAVQDFRFVWEGRVFTVGVSIGLVELNEENHFIDEVMSIADTACYAAKDKGRNRIHAYTESDEDVKTRHNEMQQVSKINDALANDRFALQAQLIYNMQQPTEMLHYELLIRMFDEEDNLVPPGLFLPAAERYGLMPSIDKWVINHYFAWLQHNPLHMARVGKCAINLSGPSLAEESMQNYILDCFDHYKIPYNKICFEITESMAIQQLDATLSFIKCFRDLGCSFALDDFGSGFSSYGYLKNLPVDYLKIDGSFVKDMLVDPIDRAMVKSIYEVAKAIGMETVAEFVESEDILADLRGIGINYGQGYGIAKPMNLDDFVKKFGRSGRFEMGS
ncbi:EAL domain-containing protein [Catenovulum sp. SX2]|uniref:EAL domain-containing protein n=1 Tax=Catenovulum sp. SX2 TaxID=3398614 RepID=UPI003F838CD7